MNRKLIISSSSSSVLLCYYEERCLGARSERLFLNEKERKDSSRFSPFSFVFFFDESTVKFFHQPWKERKGKRRANMSLHSISLWWIVSTQTTTLTTTTTTTTTKKKKKKKKTKEIDNKYTEYS